MGAGKTGHRCPRHSGQLALPSHEAPATFQKDATGPWRRVVFKAESALLQHSCDQPFSQTGFPVACRESVDGGPRGPGSLGPAGAARLRVLAAPGPSASAPPRTLRAGPRCDSGPARWLGLRPLRLPRDPFLDMSVAAHDPNAAASPVTSSGRCSCSTQVR